MMPVMNTTLLPIGTRVKHSGHGPGTIQAYNNTPPNNYAAEHLCSPHVGMAVTAGLGAAIVSSLYDGGRFPYVIQFDPTEQYPDGYKDVYALDDVEAL